MVVSLGSLGLGFFLGFHPCWRCPPLWSLCRSCCERLLPCVKCAQNMSLCQHELCRFKDCCAAVARHGAAQTTQRLDWLERFRWTFKGFGDLQTGKILLARVLKVSRGEPDDVLLLGPLFQRALICWGRWCLRSLVSYDRPSGSDFSFDKGVVLILFAPQSAMVCALDLTWAIWMKN